MLFFLTTEYFSIVLSILTYIISKLGNMKFVTVFEEADEEAQVFSFSWRLYI